VSLAEDTARRDAEKLRATQTLVSHMSFCWRHPSIVAIEIVWRWLFGVPFLVVLWVQAQVILTQIPPASTGLARLNAQNPWVSSVLLSDAVGEYQPVVMQAMRWLLPVVFVAWALLSGLGRTLVLWRMEALDPTTLSRRPSFLRKAAGVVGLQALWLLALLGCFWLWYRGVSWASSTHITAAAEPNLVAYLCWLIFLSLGLFTLWAVVSWTLAIAPVLYLLDPDANPASAVVRSFRLGKAFSSKLVEVNLVMAIVKIALIVLAMVFSAAPLPFSDQFGQDFMHLLYVVIAIAFCIANDYFHVVRLRSFVALWRIYRKV
jgi:hypothetical protein